MNSPELPKSENPLQDSTQEQCDPENYLTVLTPKIKLSKLAKTIIRECAADPQLKTVYQVYSNVFRLTSNKEYTVEQVGAYLRHTKAKLQRKKLLSESLKNTNKICRTVTNLLTNTNVSLTPKKRDMIGYSLTARSGRC